LSTEAITTILGLLGQHTMTQALQVKILSSIAIFKEEVDSGGHVQVTAKQRTELFHEHVQALSQEERRGNMPPFLLVADTVVEECTDIAIKNYQEDHHTRRALSAYRQHLQSFEPAERLATLLEDWRFCRFKTTHTASRSMLEIGVSPACSEHARPVLKAILHVMKHEYNGVSKAGTAPKTRIEQRIEAAMRAMGAWR
jgi:hypothetical protein